MLQLKQITKDYKVADTVVNALKGVDLAFRRNEFVSILGPSGCGKTTLLNIIGGLDHYTSGELLIDGISTKNYKDRDWDTYRNHRIGFIFQSYNLIPHQTILQNVELALTISGMSKEERVKRAKEALDKVGLSDQYNKKPNQLSGGQCQRVAIARALVNEPEILLADEPTGALDTTTSSQIMDLIKEIANDRLVIMVTHNPDIAENYSTRIIRLLDGLVVADSNPYAIEEEQPQTQSEAPEVVDEKGSAKNKAVSKKSKLSLWQAFKLSARNLLSKIKRTILVCLAGSIGIIGVATVLAVSTGVQNYIDQMQNDMLSGNPITISEEALNISALMEQSGSLTIEDVEKTVEDGKINVDLLVEYLINRSEDLQSLLVTNEITQQYIDYLEDMPQEYYYTISKNYGIEIANNLYTSFTFADWNNDDPQNHGNHQKVTSLSVATQMYTSMLELTEFSQFSSYISTLSDTFMLSPGNEDFILNQYDIISDPNTSKVATEANEIMIVVSDDTELTDILLAQLGYYSQEQFFNLLYKSVPNYNQNYREELWKDQFTYDELLNKKFYYYPNDTIFTRNHTGDIIKDNANPFSYSAYQDESWTTGMELKVTAILRPKEELLYGSLQSGFYYTPALAQKVIEDNINSQIAQFLNAPENESMEGSFTGMYYFNEELGIPLNLGVTYNYNYAFVNPLENEKKIYVNQLGYLGSRSTMSIIGSLMGGGTNIPDYYTLSVRQLGGVDIPIRVSIYPKDFNQKDKITAWLNAWNNKIDQPLIYGEEGNQTVIPGGRDEIIYTDTLELVITLVNNMIDMITAALISFTSLSLVVSTVMIAIITYVSVIERIKEIGVIRALGGRKRDVSNLFSAETFIIGATSGIAGVAITYGISGIINLIVGSITGIYTIASLTIPAALIMIAVSILLTSISGIIPARLAAKKDPVVALRSE